MANARYGERVWVLMGERFWVAMANAKLLTTGYSQCILKFSGFLPTTAGY